MTGRSAFRALFFQRVYGLLFEKGEHGLTPALVYKRKIAK